MKAIFLILLLIHGLVHLIGHYNAYNPGKIDGMTLPVSRGYGFAWLAAAILLVTTTGLLLFNLSFWWFLGCFSLTLSQFLVIRFWQDARYGTIGNIILLFGLIIGVSNWSFQRVFQEDIHRGLASSESIETGPLLTSDLEHLPQVVQKYLRYTGVVGKPKVYNFKVRLRAEMRNKGEDWFKVRSEQYNFLNPYRRHFFLRAKVKGLPVIGYHNYQDRGARMEIKALALFSIIDESGPQMFEAETVTLFNDMCIMAPATLIDQNISWEEVDEYLVRGYFNNGTTKISALLEFNEIGQLINFTSDDRFNLDAGKKMRFSTPVQNYREKNGMTLASYGETIWHYADEAFVYGKFDIRDVHYNVK